MLITKYNPLVPSLVDRDEFLTPFSNLFDEFFNSSFEVLGKDFFDKGTYPKVDVRNEETQIVIEAEIPGLKKEQVNIELDKGVLRIKGEKKNVDEKKSKSYVHRELKHSSFCRSFVIGNNIDSEKLSAKFEDGVLEIVLPKKVADPKTETPKKIEIK